MLFQYLGAFLLGMGTNYTINNYQGVIYNSIYLYSFIKYNVSKFINRYFKKVKTVESFAHCVYQNNVVKTFYKISMPYYDDWVRMLNHAKQTFLVAKTSPIPLIKNTCVFLENIYLFYLVACSLCMFLYKKKNGLVKDESIDNHFNEGLSYEFMILHDGHSHMNKIIINDVDNVDTNNNDNNNNNNNDNVNDNVKGVYSKEEILTMLTNISSTDQVCKYKFVSIGVELTEDGKKQFYELKLRDETNNYYVVGNRINKYVIYYLLKKQHNTNIYGLPYTLSVMDDSINMWTCGVDDEIVLNEEKYLVYMKK
jgi:hypothetical protein